MILHKKVLFVFSDVLIDAKVYEDPKQIFSLAGDILDRNLDIGANGSPFGGNDDIRRIQQDYHKIYDHVYFFGNLPIESEDLSYEQDLTARGFQIENFRRKFVGTTTKRQEHEEIVEYANSYNELYSNTELFVETKALYSCSSSYFVNGHGSPEGIHFQNGEVIPLNRYISDLKQLAVKFDLKNVRLILAMCHGHIHSHENNPLNDFHVCSLSNEERKYTFYTVQHDDLCKTLSTGFLTSLANSKRDPRPVKNSSHLDLERYAEIRNKEDVRTSKILPGSELVVGQTQLSAIHSEQSSLNTMDVSPDNEALNLESVGPRYDIERRAVTESDDGFPDSIDNDELNQEYAEAVDEDINYQVVPESDLVPDLQQDFNRDSSFSLPIQFPVTESGLECGALSVESISDDLSSEIPRFSGTDREVAPTLEKNNSRSDKYEVTDSNDPIQNVSPNPYTQPDQMEHVGTLVGESVNGACRNESECSGNQSNPRDLNDIYEIDTVQVDNSGRNSFEIKKIRTERNSAEDFEGEAIDPDQNMTDSLENSANPMDQNDSAILKGQTTPARQATSISARQSLSDSESESETVNSSTQTQVTDIVANVDECNMYGYKQLEQNTVVSKDCDLLRKRQLDKPRDENHKMSMEPRETAQRMIENKNEMLIKLFFITIIVLCCIIAGLLFWIVQLLQNTDKV